MGGGPSALPGPVSLSESDLLRPHRRGSPHGSGTQARRAAHRPWCQLCPGAVPGASARPPVASRSHHPSPPRSLLAPSEVEDQRLAKHRGVNQFHPVLWRWRPPAGLLRVPALALGQETESHAWHFWGHGRPPVDFLLPSPQARQVGLTSESGFWVPRVQRTSCPPVVQPCTHPQGFLRPIRGRSGVLGASADGHAPGNGTPTRSLRRGLQHLHIYFLRNPRMYRIFILNFYLKAVIKLV